MNKSTNWDAKAAALDDLILAIGQHIAQYFATRSEDLTLREMFILESLGRREFATMTELASSLAVPLTTMTSIVTRLVQKGYLDRQRIEEDRRVVRVSLSAAGRELYERQRHDFVRSVRELLGTLPAEEQHKILALIAETLTLMSREQ